MPLIETQGVVVRAWDWSETSQTAAVFTPDHGLIRVLAKGSKRPGAPFSGGLELCTLGELACIDKPSSELALLTSWDLTDPVLGIRASLDRYRAAMVAIELVPRMVRDRDPHPNAFGALSAILRRCADPEPLGDAERHALLVRFLWTMLAEAGAMPILDEDAVTGGPLPDAAVYGFSPEHGGVTKDPGPDQTGAGASDQRVWRVRARTLSTLRSLTSGRASPSFSDPDDDDVRRACTLLAAYTSERVGAEIPSMRWLLAGAAVGPHS